MINELECVHNVIYANLWQTDFILRINKVTGGVNGVLYAGGLLTQEQRAAGANVLNGIAYDAENDVFYLTGKLWPSVFEVKIMLYDGTR
jgi:glutaminyl-peptide cyclotransferase